MSQEKQERNKQLYEDYKAGMSRAELIAKYKVGPTRVQAIITAEKLKELQDKDEKARD